MRKSNIFPFIFLGNVLEHHDKALFSLLVPIIGQQFFANSDSISILIQTYSALFLSLFARPLGALFFGYLADTSGKLKVLSLTILGMSFATFGIGFLPSYEKIGVFAPIFLITFRGLQNFFAAGETNAAALYTIERSNMKPVMAGLFEASTVFGILLASLELSILSYFDQMQKWPFLFWTAGIFGLIGFYIRKESEAEEAKIENRNVSFRDLITNYKELLAIIAASGFSCATYVMSITFFNSFLFITENLSINELNHMNFFLLALDACLLPFFGWLAWRWNVEKMMICATTAMLFLAIPLFQTLENADLFTIVCIRVIIVSIGACFAACFRTWAQNLLPENIRCTTLSIGCSVAHLFIEGPLILLSLWAFRQTGLLACPGILFSMLSAITLFALFKVKKTTIVPSTVTV